MDWQPVEMNVLTLVKGPQRFIFIYRDDSASRVKVLRTIGRWAADPLLEFTWADAAFLSSRVRGEAPPPPPPPGGFQTHAQVCEWLQTINLRPANREGHRCPDCADPALPHCDQCYRELGGGA